LRDPIIMAHPMGFYSKHGLDVEVIKTAGWAVIRDKTLNKEYDAAHMLSPMPLAITLGAGSAAIPYTMPAVENINGQAITLAIKHKDRRDPKDWKGFKLAVPFDYSMHNYCCATTSPSTGSTPIPTSRSARCRRRKWSPISVPTTSTGFSSRPVQPACGLRRRRLHPPSVEGNLGRAPLLRLRGIEGVHHRDAEYVWCAPEGDHRRDRLRCEVRKPKADRRGDRAGELS